jgi:hypothetical protein
MPRVDLLYPALGMLGSLWLVSQVHTPIRSCDADALYMLAATNQGPMHPSVAGSGGDARLRVAPFLLVNRACSHALSLTDQN